MSVEPDLVALENRFHHQMLAIHGEALHACNYNATLFRHMVLERGGLATAQALLANPGISSGLAELCLCGRLDLTVEAHVVQPEWQPLFAAEEIATARRRLKELGYDPHA